MYVTYWLYGTITGSWKKNISTGQLSQSVCEFFGSVWKFIWSICEFFGRVCGVWVSVIEIFWECLREIFQSVIEILRTSFWPIYKKIIHCCSRTIQIQISNFATIRKLRTLQLQISNFSDIFHLLQTYIYFQFIGHWLAEESVGHWSFYFVAFSFFLFLK